MAVGLSRRVALLAILAGGIALGGGPRAHADFTLTLTDSATGTSLFIDNTTGTYTYTAGTGDVSSSDMFAIDGNIFSYSSTSGSFSPSLGNLITFSSGTGRFGNFANAQIQITSNAPGTVQSGKVFDTNISTRNTSGAADTLTAAVTSTGFTLPGSLGSQMLLRNVLSLSDLSQPSDVGYTQFTSALNGQATPTAQVTASQFSSGTLGALTTATVVQTSSPYTLTNSLVLNLGANGTANFTGTTTALLPEPGTIAMTLAALPVMGFSFWRRRAKA